MTKPMEWGFIYIKMDQNTLEIGLKMDNMVLESSNGRMVLLMKGNSFLI